MTRIKICGLTEQQHATWADKHGADAIGFLFADSPRRVTPEQAHAIQRVLSPFVKTVGVFVNTTHAQIDNVLAQVRLDVLQLHGDESPKFIATARRQFRLPIVKAIRVRDHVTNYDLATYQADAYLLDTYVPGQAGGTGKNFDWSLAVPLVKHHRIILAGGLHPNNIAKALQTVQPYGVDVSSGVEQAPGVKDEQAIEQFIQRVKQSDVANNQRALR